MENTKSFYDLRVRENVKNHWISFANKYAELGFKTLAIDHIVDITEEAKGKKTKKKKDERSIVPEPTKIDELLKQCPDLDLKVITRITIIADDKESLMNIVKYENFKKYHIFAIQPKSTEILKFIADVFDVDIVSFDPLDIKGIKINLKLYNKIVSKGIYFEISYCPAIVDQTLRRNIIQCSHWYKQVGKSKNVIITSGCNSFTTLRGPYDIIHLGLVFGLNKIQAKYSITSAGYNVIKHSVARKIGKATVFISDSSNEVMEIVDSDEEEMQPIQKKIKY